MFLSSSSVLCSSSSLLLRSSCEPPLQPSFTVSCKLATTAKLPPSPASLRRRIETPIGGSKVASPDPSSALPDPTSRRRIKAFLAGSKLCTIGRFSASPRRQFFLL